MPAPKLTGIRALVKLREERAVIDQREAAARREASIELGAVVLAAGAEVLSLADLKRVLIAAVEAHSAKAQAPHCRKTGAPRANEASPGDDHVAGN